MNKWTIKKKAKNFKPFYIVTRDSDAIIVDKNGECMSEDMTDYMFKTEEEAQQIIKLAAKVLFESLSKDNFGEDVNTSEDIESEFSIEKISNDEEMLDFLTYFRNTKY